MSILATVLAVAVVAAFFLILWAALGKWPLTSTRVVWVVGFILIGIVNVGLGTLSGGAVFEWRNRSLSPLSWVDALFMFLALVVLAAVDGCFAWWLFSSGQGAFMRWLFLIVALLEIVAGVLSVWHPLPLLRRRSEKDKIPIWPHHESEAEGWGPFTPLSVLLGVVLGASLAVAYVGISAWHENADVPPGPSMPTSVTWPGGGYVALGDSYSAGEGLTPFVAGTSETHCDQSQRDAYPTRLDNSLRPAPRSFTFSACSGALIKEIYEPTQRSRLVPPQVDGSGHPSVKLVTLTIGGDNAIFSKVVSTCLIQGNCLQSIFPPQLTDEATKVSVQRGVMLTNWGPQTIEEIGSEDAALFENLSNSFKNARIIVIGYPYLFPDTAAPNFPWWPPECASVLNRLSQKERDGIRLLQDEFNNRIYEEAVASNIEFVSPNAIWGRHEPCGSSRQYTNSIKPYLNFPNPVNGGSFHPNVAGQEALTALVGCYLDRYRTKPDPFQPGKPRSLAIPATSLADPTALNLVQAPGSTTVPGHGTIAGC